MKQVIYAAVFKGRGAPKDPKDPNLWVAKNVASSASITTVAGKNGLESSVKKVPGGDIVFDSESKLLTKTSFLEWGTITFGPGHVLRFSTVGEGVLGPSADRDVQHGAVMWSVDGGEGQFKGATGFITSNFTVGKDGTATDHQFGVIYLK
ncbi:MAG: hypothetical protein FJ312_04675 [SAR202 cluster bacterium]|nr:hypothetical protein [SAR202 cluster bacterium]